MTFDPYAAWLGLPPGLRPPDPYSLLGVSRDERDPARISAAAAERVRLVNRKAPFDRGDEMRTVLAEISAAERLLSDPTRCRPVELGPQPAGTVPPTSPPKSRHPVRSVRRTAAPAGAAHPAPSETVRQRERLRQFGVISGAIVAATFSVAAAWVAWPGSEENAQEPSLEAVAGRGLPKEVVSEDALLPVRRAAIDSKAPVEAARPAAPVADAAPANRPPEAPVASAFPAAVPVPVEAGKPAYDSIGEYRLPPFGSDSEREAYARHVGELLQESFESKADTDAMAGHLRAAEALAPGDPFTEYAAAVAYWKRLKFAEAEAHLRKARGPDENPFVPARRAGIRFDLNRSRRTEALTEVVEFASALGAMRDDRAAEASIRWLGRLVAALGSPWLPEPPPKDVADADAKIRETLGPEPVAAYEAGRRSLLDDYAARAAAVEAEIAQLAVAHEAERAETLDEITANRDEAEGQREEAARTASEWKDWLDQETKGLDDELKQLEAANQQLTVQAEAVAATYLTLSAEIGRQQARDEIDDLPGRGSTVSPQMVAAANQALAELKILNARLAEVQGRARVLLAKRQTVVAKFERETKTLAAKTHALRKWENVLKRRAEETGAEEAADTPAAKALRRRLRDVAAYVPFDLAAERDSLLRALRENR